MHVSWYFVAQLLMEECPLPIGLPVGLPAGLPVVVSWASINDSRNVIESRRHLNVITVENFTQQ